MVVDLIEFKTDIQGGVKKPDYSPIGNSVGNFSLLSRFFKSLSAV